MEKVLMDLTELLKEYGLIEQIEVETAIDMNGACISLAFGRERAYLRDFPVLSDKIDEIIKDRPCLTATEMIDMLKEKTV